MYLMRCYRPDGSVRKESKRIAAFADATESSLTLYALRDALSRFRCGCEIVLHTECGYVAAAINRGWPEKWRDSGWRNQRGKPVANEILWSQILQAAEENGHKLTVREGKHEWSEWMRWNLPLLGAYEDIFAEVRIE